jgi:glyoxylase-like metal-dependent hydrolase (beta-lactamase superfamily II)
MVYLIKGHDGQGLLVDAGAGPSQERILANVRSAGVEPDGLKDILLTHCHIDHVGGAPGIIEATGCRVWCHAGDLDGVCGENPGRTAEDWYGLEYPGVDVDVVLGGGIGKCRESEEEGGDAVGMAKKHAAAKMAGGTWGGDGPWRLAVGGLELTVLHTPGHTPGSVCAYMDLEAEGKRVLFAQDAHGPFDDAWGSDREMWRRSVEALLDLEADVLCEGHYGIYKSASSVRGYLEGLLG